MNKYITSFGGKEQGKNRHNDSYGITRWYDEEVKRLFSSGEQFGLIPMKGYDNDWLLNSEWNKKFPEVMKLDSFSWSFKPIVILECLNKMEDGDYLLWMDSNDILIANPQPLFDFATEYNIYFHDHYPTYYPNWQWTTRDMFREMDCVENKYFECPQIQVNIMAFHKTEFTMKFVEEWTHYATMYSCIAAHTLDELPNWCQSRHEQSIASILRVKYNMPCAGGYPEYIAHELMGINKDG